MDTSYDKTIFPILPPALRNFWHLISKLISWNQVGCRTFGLSIHLYVLLPVSPRRMSAPRSHWNYARIRYLQTRETFCRLLLWWRWRWFDDDDGDHGTVVAFSRLAWLAFLACFGWMDLPHDMTIAWPITHEAHQHPQQFLAPQTRSHWASLGHWWTMQSAGLSSLLQHVFEASWQRTQSDSERCLAMETVWDS